MSIRPDSTADASVASIVAPDLFNGGSRGAAVVLGWCVLAAGALAPVAAGAPSGGPAAAAAPSSALPPTWTEPHTGMVFVLVPPGRFRMGSPDSEPRRETQETLHEVVISHAFYLGRDEVTQEEWRRVLGANPSHFPDCGPRCPVESVSFLDAQRFVDRLIELAPGERFRLPTEAEWEYACRAGHDDAFGGAATLSAEQANLDGRDPYPGARSGPFRGRPTPVGTFPANAWGLRDVHGNVWEWTLDDHCPYPSGPLTDPRGRCTSGLKVIRGGSWYFGADSARCALRYTHRPQDRGPSLGLRLVREIPLQED